MRREYPDRPILSVGLLVRRGDEVLIIQRGRAPSKGRWSVPGGAVELGETLRQAGEREVREECGVTVKAGELADIFETIVPGADGRTRYHYVAIDFLAEYVSGELAPASDVMDARWVDRQGLLALDVTERARELLLRTLSH